jgi:sulfur-oxidizing protein SoxB
MLRREFLRGLAIALANGICPARAAPVGAERGDPYAAAPFGQIRLLHITDCHGQLLPGHHREAEFNLGVGREATRPPHLTGEELLRHFGIRCDDRAAYTLTHLNFSNAARRFGKTGGFAHLATLIHALRAEQPHSLLLDGGDSWQGSACALWNEGRDMIAASKLLGVQAMTGHWEFTYGADRVLRAVAEELSPQCEFLGQNVSTADFGDPVFKPYVLRELNGVLVAVIGQCFPYIPIAHPRHFVPDWRFGIEEAGLQRHIDAVRGQGAQLVVLLSHNGTDADLKLASRLRDLDVILGGHSHEPLPQPILVAGRSGKTLVTNAGSNGKFVGVLDLQLRGQVTDFRYRLLPVLSELLPADAAMASLIAAYHEPHQTRLDQTLALSEGLLYRRGTFGGSWDRLIIDALLATLDAEIALTPGFRWGTSILPGDPIRFADVMNSAAITYPQCVVIELSGREIKNMLEDIADNLFNPDPYYRQGGDMARCGGLSFTCRPNAPMHGRIDDLRVRGRPIDPTRRYKVARWAPLNEDARGEPLWDVLARYLRERKSIPPLQPNWPAIDLAP